MHTKRSMAVRLAPGHRGLEWAPERTQRGAVALLGVTVLCFLALFALAYTHQVLTTEQRLAAHQYRAASAFETAEAGLQWSLAQLNNRSALDAACRETDPPGAGSAFRDIYVEIDRTTGALNPVVGHAGGASVALRPNCSLDNTDPDVPVQWHCACPLSAAAAASAVAPAAPAPGATFAVQFDTASTARAIRVQAFGCTSADGGCPSATPGPGDADGAAHLQATYLLRPGLAAFPSAPLTLRGDAVGTGAVGLHNADAASGGWTLQAGGAVALANVRLTTVAGAAADQTLLAGDTALAAATGDALFVQLVGLDKTRWRQQPAVQTFACAGICDEVLISAVGSAAGPALLWVDGDVHLTGPLSLGSSDRPIMLVASGRIVLEGAVVITGLVYGRDLQWLASGPAGGLLRGAAVSESGFGATGSPDLVYDRPVLERLRDGSGSYVQVPGSWHDF